MIAHDHRRICRRLKLGFDQTLDRLRVALRHQGLNVICEVPFHREFKKTMGVVCRQYSVFVVWAQFETYRAVLTEPEAGLMMPFNIAVADTGDETTITVSLRRSSTSLGISMIQRDLDAKLLKVLAECEQQNQAMETRR